MSSTTRKRPTRRNLRVSTYDGAFFSLTVGLGETYIPAFVLAAGLGEVASGLAAPAPMILGATLQLLTPFGARWLGSLRLWVVGCATLQALSFVPLALSAATHYAPLWLVFSAATIYWAAGMATGPAWNTWMTNLVPRRARAHFFAKRTRVIQAAALLALLVGGLALHYATQAGSPPSEYLYMYALLFAGAGLSRLTSATFLSMQSETTQAIHAHRNVTFRDLGKRLRHGADAKLIFYLFVVQTAVQFAAPYLTPFVLERLNYPYGVLMSLLAATYLAKSLATPWFGRLATRIGPLNLLWIGGVCIIPQTGLWTWSHNITYLIIVQILGGVAWAAHELATFLLYFETMPEEERTSLLTTYNFTNALATVFGAALGGLLLRGCGQDIAAYHVVFLVSMIARLGTLPLLMRIPNSGARVKTAVPPTEA